MAPDGERAPSGGNRMDDKTLIMTEYDIKLSLGHVLIDGGNGRLLVDTGVP